MPKIEIISTPSGQAPEWVRDAWLHLVLPVDTETVGVLQMGIYGGEPQNQGGYNVLTEVALSILEMNNKEEAAAWWREFFEDFPVIPSCLTFREDFCKLIEE